MTKSKPLQEKSYLFALNIVAICRHLANQKEFVLSKQLLKSGTSIGANIEEAQHSESRRDFVSKFSIALKEAYESRFWIRLIHDSYPNIQMRTASLLDEINQIIPLLISSIKTARSKLR